MQWISREFAFLQLVQRIKFSFFIRLMEKRRQVSWTIFLMKSFFEESAWERLNFLFFSFNFRVGRFTSSFQLIIPALAKGYFRNWPALADFLQNLTLQSGENINETSKFSSLDILSEWSISKILISGESETRIQNKYFRVKGSEYFSTWTNKNALSMLDRQRKIHLCWRILDVGKCGKIVDRDFDRHGTFQPIFAKLNDVGCDFYIFAIFPTEIGWKTIVPGNCKTYNKNCNAKSGNANNILMSEPTLRCYFSDYRSYCMKRLKYWGLLDEHETRM